MDYNVGCLTLAGPVVFLHTEAQGCDPLAVWPLIELELRGKKNERVGRYKTQRLIPEFKVSGQPVTSQVR